MRGYENVSSLVADVLPDGTYLLQNVVRSLVLLDGKVSPPFPSQLPALWAVVSLHRFQFDACVVVLACIPFSSQKSGSSFFVGFFFPFLVVLSVLPFPCARVLSVWVLSSLWGLCCGNVCVLALYALIFCVLHGSQMGLIFVCYFPLYLFVVLGWIGNVRQLLFGADLFVMNSGIHVQNLSPWSRPVPFPFARLGHGQSAHRGF